MTHAPGPKTITGEDRKAADRERVLLGAAALRDAAIQMPAWSALTALLFLYLPGFQGGTAETLAAWAALHWLAALGLYLAARACLAGCAAPFGLSWETVLSGAMAFAAFVWGLLQWVAFAPGNPTNQTFLMLLVFTAISLYAMRYSLLPAAFAAASGALLAVTLARHILALEPHLPVFLVVIPVFIAAFVKSGLAHGRKVTLMLETRIANERLAAENAAARDAALNANAAKSAFLANMSHELRTPLNAVIGFADLIRHAPNEPWEKPRHREYAGDIAESARTLLGMINSLLDIAKIEAGKMAIEPESLDTGDEIAGLIRLIEPLAAKNRQTLSSAVEIARVHADPRALRSMLVNLLSNAVKYAGEGAAIAVEAKAVEAGVEIAVADTGRGIPQAAAARLFERFERVDNSYTAAPGGTGLGLSLVRELARLHGGDASIASGPGKGTRVSVVLPLRPDLRFAA